VRPREGDARARGMNLEVGSGYRLVSVCASVSVFVAAYRRGREEGDRERGKGE